MDEEHQVLDEVTALVVEALKAYDVLTRGSGMTSWSVPPESDIQFGYKGQSYNLNLTMAPEGSRRHRVYRVAFTVGEHP